MTIEDNENTRATLRQLAADLEGTCQSGDEASHVHFGIDLSELPQSLLEALDDMVFCCDTCGWYCSTDEQQDGENDAPVCQQCSDDEEQDDDDD